MFSYQFQSVLIAPVLEGVLVTSKARPLSVPCFISCHLFARPEKRQNYFGRLRTQSDWLRSRHTCRQLHENRLRGNFPSRTRRASPCLAPFLRVAQRRFQVPTQSLHAFFFFPLLLLERGFSPTPSPHELLSLRCGEGSVAV